MFFHVNLTMENNVLRWMCSPQLLTPDECINNVLTILQDLRVSPMDLLLVTLSLHTQYKTYKDSFYHGNTHAISRFLNVVEAEKCEHEKLMAWGQSRALRIVLEEIARKWMHSECCECPSKTLHWSYSLNSISKQQSQMFWNSIHCGFDKFSSPLPKRFVPLNKIQRK